MSAVGVRQRTIVLSGGPCDGEVRDFCYPLELRILIPASPEVWPPADLYGPVKPRHHRYVREDTPKMWLDANLAITYRYEGTR